MKTRARSSTSLDTHVGVGVQRRARGPRSTSSRIDYVRRPVLIKPRAPGEERRGLQAFSRPVARASSRAAYQTVGQRSHTGAVEGRDSCRNTSNESRRRRLETDARRIRRRRHERKHASLPTSMISLVPKTGLEPVRPCGRRILNPLRLPIPPLRRTYETATLVASGEHRHPKPTLSDIHASGFQAAAGLCSARCRSLHGEG
jgi:hypothetical protein